MLAAALVALIALGGGGLYANGYWDTWEDRTEQVASEIEADMRMKAEGQDVPETVFKTFAPCAAKVVVSTAQELECELNKEGESPLEAAVVCINMNPIALALASEDLVQCVRETQEAVAKDLGQ